EQRKQYLPYYFPEQAAFSKAQKEVARLDFAGKYCLNPEDLWIVNMGTVTPRKGIHEFLEVAAITKAAQKKVSFIWIGGYENEETKLQVEAALKKMEYPGILFTGALPHNATNLLPFDVFFLSSREDPYPLVVVEAAYLAVPSICFDGSGGIPEFIENDAGWLIPDFSAGKAADCIIDININRTIIGEKGGKARLKAIARHSNETLIIDKFTKAININID
ncbi:MAG: glycosyltransferase family 4 protein, partial [Bacteroidota bacterium]